MKSVPCIVISNFSKGVDKMKLECNVVEKTSKAGTPYLVLRIQLSEKPSVTKDVFLNDAEVAILSLNEQ